MGAIGRGHVNDQMQLPSCVLDILTLELLALGIVCPGQPLVDVESCVQGPGDHQEAPADRLKQKSADQESWRENMFSSAANKISFSRPNIKLSDILSS